MWVTAEQCGRHLIGLASLAVLARLLPSTAFGIVAMAAVFVDYLALLVSQGLGFAIVQRSDLQAKHLSSAFWMNLAISGLMCVLMLALAPLFARFAGMPVLAAVLPVLSLSLVANGLSRVQAALLTREMRFRATSAVGISSGAVGGLVGISMALAGCELWSLVAQALASSATTSALLWLVSPWRPSLHISLPHLRQLYGYSAKVLADQHLLFVTRRLDEVLLGLCLGPAQLGCYSIAKRLVILISDFFVGTIQSVIFPAFCRLQSDKARLNRALLSATKVSAIVTIAPFAGLIALAPEIVPLLFGSKWLSAVLPMQLLSIGAPFVLAPILLHSVLHALGRPGLPLALNGGRAALSAILLPTAASLGLPFVAAAWSLSRIAGAVADAFAIRALARIPLVPLILSAIAPLLAGVLMALTSRLAADAARQVGSGFLVPLFLGTVVGGVFFAAALATLGRESLSEVFRAAHSALEARAATAPREN